MNFLQAGRIFGRYFADVTPVRACIARRRLTFRFRRFGEEKSLTLCQRQNDYRPAGNVLYHLR